ncbi:prolipoprotein diacylglyceryl transferase [Rhodopseudomonas palustris]|uniref:prolipoprotein diacylglyceryl transferase n=1 Tax=Rhodopseudomonas palustris TaxID=1076 RepID=UPI0021F38887|nr:prolipoprotein diacylglyceryl transferase [Rhodopseudomonas palustris]UYO43980.1 prolipoprotein diacylglyceryl transferase [Rhodopseudomonas palustris]
MPFFAVAFPVFDPVAVAIGPFAIRWYALAYIAGIVIGWLYARMLLQRQRLWGGPSPISLEAFDDFILWITIGIILGGRTGYVLFYNLDFFIRHPAEIFELWKGGMSFHGGFMGCVLAVVLFGWKRKVPILSLGDITCAVGPIGLFLGRIANFINGELWGRPADASVPWAMVFPHAGPLPRHPSQLYEAGLEGIGLFVILALMIRAGALKRPGLIIGAFLTFYGLARITGEFFREPDPQLGFLWGGLTMGMLLSVPMVIVGIGVMITTWRRGRVTPAAAPTPSSEAAS